MTEKKVIKEVYTPKTQKSEKHPQVHVPRPPAKPSRPRPPQGGGIPPAGTRKPTAPPEADESGANTEAR